MSANEWLSILSNAATIVAVPIAVLVYVNEKRKERREREYGTYNALDDKYIEYLQLCITHPRLNLYSTGLPVPAELTPEELIERDAMFEILISILERAYLMYRDQTNDVKKAQWDGWNTYMKDWTDRADFRDLWNRLGYQFDADFSNHMRSLIDSPGASSPSPAS